MKRFTFIEILIAVTIMAVSLVMVMTVVGSAQSNIIKAQSNWGQSHLLTQATEFYLLAGPDGNMPDEFLPQNYSSSCTLNPFEGELPEHAIDPLNGFVPGVYRVEVTGLQGETIGIRKVLKLVPEEEL